MSAYLFLSITLIKCLIVSIPSSNKTDKAILLNPKDYIKLAKDTPKAISIYYGNEVNHLLPYAKAKIVIITKGGQK